MQSLIVLILALSIIMLVVQISLADKNWQKLALIFMMGSFSFAAYPYAIKQSYTSILQLMTDHEFLVDFSVLQIAEAILGILLSLLLFKEAIGEKANRWLVLLKYIPGIICFPAVFWGQSYLFLKIPNSNFMWLAAGIASGLTLMLVIMVFGFSRVIYEYELRCEVKIFLHVLQVISAVVLYLFTAGLPVSRLPQNKSFWPFVVLFAGVLLFFATGCLLYFFKMKRFDKLKNN